MKTKVSPYFVLYLVALTGLLLVINERDIAEREGREIISILASGFSTRPVLSVSDTVRLPLNGEQPILLSAAGLNSEAEKASVRYTVNPVDSVPPNWGSKRLERDVEGNGLLYVRFDRRAGYKFDAYCEVDREIPKNITERLRKRLSQLLQKNLTQQSLPVTFVLKVGEEGERLPLTFNIERTSDKWITGKKYTKRIFVSNVVLSQVAVSIASSPKKPLYTATLGNTILLNWDSPDSGITNITLSGFAKRGLGKGDFAEAKFVVEVGPPRWQPEPRPTAYKNVKYRWESGLGGMSADEFAVQMYANNVLVETISPSQYPFDKKIEPGWSVVSFKAVANDNLLKQVDIQVKEPPPPQIKWGEETRGENMHIVRFYCEDIDGSPVTINMNVIQPQGVRASIEPSGKGKNFTITIKDVSNIRTPHVELQVQAIGIGGVSKTPARTIIIRYN